MLKTEMATFKDVEFTATQFPALKAFKLAQRLAKTIGPILAGMASAGQIDLNDLRQAVVLEKAAEALSTLDTDESTKLSLELLTCVEARWTDESGRNQKRMLDSEPNINLVFMGRLSAMFQVVFLSAKVNFGDFFAELAPSEPPPPALPVV